MKKIYFLIAAALSFVTANAQFGMYIPPEFVESEWTYVGEGTHFPGILDWATNEYPLELECKVYHSNITAGDFWVEPDITEVNPEEFMAPGPYIVHIQNVDKVWTSPIWSGHPGVFCFYQMVTELVPNKASDANYGKYADGVVSFPANSFYFATMPTGEPYTNVNGNFKIAMPDIDKYLPQQNQEEKDKYICEAVTADDFNMDELKYIGKGVHFPGIFDNFDNEYPLELDCAIYASKTVEGDYWILPDISEVNFEEFVAPGPYVVHIQDVNKVWTNMIWALNPFIFGYTSLVPEVMGIQGSEAHYGKMVDNVVSFPANSYYWSTNPIEKPLSNKNGNFKVAFPDPSGVTDINVDQKDVEFYNLQGVKVSNPTKGVYIMKQGKKVQKIRF